MNNNSYNMNRNYQSSSSLCPSSGTQRPYMFGGSQSGQSFSSTNMGQRRNDANVSVRDCMYWPQSLAPGQATGSPYGTGEGSSMRMQQYGGGRAFSQNQQGQAPAFTFSAQPQMQQQSQQQYGGGIPSNYPQPKAFIQVQGQGQGEVKPMQIPCQMGPSGSQMAPLAPMEPLMIKVTAPPGAGANGQPIQFQINPNSLWGQRR